MNDRDQIWVVTHPYYPEGLVLPDYVSNNISTFVAFYYLFASIGVVLGLIYVYISSLSFPSTTTSPNSTTKLTWHEKFLVLWHSLCASLHIFFESHYILYSTQLSSLPTVLSQLWREYALSDSRYIRADRPDTFVYAIEAITVFLTGPLCVFVAWGIAHRKWKGETMVVRIVVATAHLWGVMLYYATAEVDRVFAGVWWSRPEAMYRWGYFWAGNAPWVVVPLFILYESLKQINCAIARDQYRPKSESEVDEYSRWIKKEE